VTRSSVSQLDRLADDLLRLDAGELSALLETLQPHELDLADLALSRRMTEPWRADPARFAEHLDGDHFRRWRYVQVIADVFARLVEADITRAVVMVPARYGKTTISSQWGPAWALDRYPWLQIVLASYGHELAVSNSLAVRDIIETHAGVLRVKVRRDKRSASRWRTTDGGQVRAVGVGSGLTGHGGDIIVIDDPFKDWQAAHSPTIREGVWNWYKSVVRTRLQTDTSAIMVVGTRWHEDDLVGRLLAPPDDSESEDWHVVRMPAIAEDPGENPHGKPWEALPDPLGRAPGEPLEPERFSLEAVKARIRALGSYLAAGMEQQRPSSLEGGILKRKWWRYYGGRPDEFTVDDWLISWDSSFDDTTTKSSYCVGQVWARTGAHKFLIDQVRDQMDYPTFRSAVVSFSRKWPQAHKVLIENKANGPAVIKDLYGLVPGLLPREPKGSKESRAHACAGEVEGGNVWLPDPGLDDIDPTVERGFVHAFVEETALFPGGSFDDQVDAFTQAVLEWQGSQIPDVSNYRRTAGAGRR
jgi:predicted phage terminase large subunit-like protein